MSRVGVVGARWFALLMAGQIIVGMGLAGVASAQEPPPGTPPAEIDPPPGDAVQIRPADADAFAPGYTVLDEMSVGSVLRIKASGFEWGIGAIRQCVQSDELRCANPLGIDFDEAGTASVHYALGDPERAADGGCGPTGDRCFVLVTDEAGNRVEIDTVFGASAPPAGAVTVSPRVPIDDETPIEVSVSGYPPGTATVLLCSPPAVGGSERCRQLSEPGEMSVDSDGTGSLSVVARPGSVGTEGVPCEWRHDCAISVESDEAFARAPAQPVTFAAPLGAGYNTTRLLIGLAIAALLVGIAIWLIFFTDWAPVGEQVAPEIDDAEYADLDEIIASLEPEEGHELV